MAGPTLLGKNIVLGRGNPHAKLVWIGETPGPEEDRERRPFIGPSGKEVEWALDNCGVQGTDVWFDNVCPLMHLPFPAGKKGYELLKKHEQHLIDSRVWQDRTPKIVVACGTWALRRLLFHRIPEIGLKNIGINKWMGSVIEWGEEDARLSAINPVMRGAPIPAGSLIIPILHPAGYLRDPSRTTRPTFQRFVHRIAGYVKRPYGQWTVREDPEIIYGLDTLPLDKQRYFVDYEFNGDTHYPYLLGVSYSGSAPVWQTRSIVEMREFFHTLCDRNASFTAHFAPADLRASFQAIGVKRFPAFIDDSLLLHSVLQPDLDHDLSFVARSYVDGIREWKWESRYPERVSGYNAKDVRNLALAWEAMVEEANDAPGDPWAAYREFIMSLPQIMDMEEIGIKIDEDARAKEKLKQTQKIIRASRTVDELTRPAVEARTTKLAAEIEALDAESDKLELDAFVKCMLESGDIKCKWASRPRTEPKRTIYDKHFGPIKPRLKEIKSARSKLDKLYTELTQRGFRVGNDNDTRWYLLEVLHKKPRAKTPSGLVKVDIASLEPFKDDPVISNIWEVKHAQKLISTFLSVAVDSAGYCHPPIKLHGTASGRPSSGKEKKGDVDKAGAGAVAFNAFNLPESIRHIFVPDDGCVFVNGDIKDLEGRLTALLSGDETLCRLYSEGLDTHSWFAAHIFGIPMEADGLWKSKVKEDYLPEGSQLVSPRYRTKRVRHGKNYGMGISKLSQVLKISKAEAQRIADMIDALAPKVKEWQESVRHFVFGKLKRIDQMGRKIWELPPHRYLATEFGRVRYFPGLEDKVAKEALSHKPQSLGSGIWYRGVARLCEPYSTKLKIGYGRLVIGTYDSFLLCVPIGKEEEAMAWAKKVLEEPFLELASLPGGSLMPLSFPIDFKVGSNYGFTLDSDDVAEPEPEPEPEEDELEETEFNLTEIVS